MAIETLEDGRNARRSRDASVKAVVGLALQATSDTAPCPDAKAECHEHAAALGIILVDEPEPSEGDTRRHRAHPMA